MGKIESLALRVPTFELIKHLIGIRVTPEEEDIGLDISEHAEQAYSDEEEFKFTPNDYMQSSSEDK